MDVREVKRLSMDHSFEESLTIRGRKMWQIYNIKQVRGRNFVLILTSFLYFYFVFKWEIQKHVYVERKPESER